MRSYNTVCVLTLLLLSCGLLVLGATTPTTTVGENKSYVEDAESAEEQLERPTPRIVGGQFASDGQFPYQVSLHVLGNFACGGSIISANYVVTAGHCVTSKPGSNYPAFYFTVRAGSSQLYSGGVYVRVVETKVHPNYGKFANDIALLRLGEKLSFNSRIKAIPLASAEPPSGSAVTISGWGRVRTNGDLPSRLKYNTLYSISNAQCNRLLSGLTSKTLCLAHTAGNGACTGDSGGPGVYKGQLVGVTNFVVNGCGSPYPDGYAKVSSFRNWLRQNSDLQ